MYNILLINKVDIMTDIQTTSSYNDVHDDMMISEEINYYCIIMIKWVCMSNVCMCMFEYLVYRQ